MKQLVPRQAAPSSGEMNAWVRVKILSRINNTLSSLEEIESIVLVGDVVCEIELEHFSVGVKVETTGFLAEIREWLCAAGAVMLFYYVSFSCQNTSIAPVNRSTFLAPGSRMTGSPTRSFLHTSWLSVVFALLRSCAACITFLFWASVAAPLYVRRTAVV
ncbi:unnamed protein product [Ectocarpus sp. CCAP 1310/34]|nr:unnamed protein product [Ectocarpus sp. CCAP 1310/34]